MSEPQSGLSNCRLSQSTADPSATLFLVMFLAGWNDGSQGPLLPSLQRYYGINYFVVSLIWMFNALGFALAGALNVYLTDWFGFGITCPLGSGLQVLAYVLICWGGPYPLFCFAFVLNGFGLGLQDAQVNTLASRLPKHASTIMFLLHAMYGLGATVAPLVSTQFVKSMDQHVYYYYAVSLGLAFFTMSALIVVFGLRTEDQILGPRPDEVESTDTATPATDATADPNHTAAPVSTLADGSDRPPSHPGDAEAAVPATEKPASGANPTSNNKMKLLLRTPSVYLMCFYMLLYVGVEVAIGGWATSFIIDERGGNDSAGYVTSGYFGGITIGRVVLIPVTRMLGMSNAIYVYTLIGIALQVVIWTTKSIVGNAVLFSIIGVLLGPMYPIVMVVVTRVIPDRLQGGAIGLIASMGQVGSAIIPFMTGGVAQHTGIWVLQPLMLSLMAAWLVFWAFVPRTKKGWRA